jgi:hypothetical protein
MVQASQEQAHLGLPSNAIKTNESDRIAHRSTSRLSGASDFPCNSDIAAPFTLMAQQFAALRATRCRTCRSNLTRFDTDDLSSTCSGTCWGLAARLPGTLASRTTTSCSCSMATALGPSGSVRPSLHSLAAPTQGLRQSRPTRGARACSGSCAIAPGATTPSLSVVKAETPLKPSRYSSNRARYLRRHTAGRTTLA